MIKYSKYLLINTKMAKTEVLKQYFEEKELKELQKNSPDKYKELSEKLSSLWNKTQVELAKLRQELENLSLDEKVDKLFDLVKKAEEKQVKAINKIKEKTWDAVKANKEELDKKWFSWDKIVETFKKEWFIAAIWLFFSWIFASIFWWFWEKIEKKFDDIKWNLEDKVEDIVSSFTKNSEWTFKKNEYLSHDENFDIKFRNNGEIEKVMINDNEYEIDKWYHLGEKEWKQCLVKWWINEFVFPLDYLWYVIDKNYSNWTNKFVIWEEKTAYDSVIPDAILKLIKWKIEFRKKDSIDKLKENKLISGEASIIFDKNIDKQDFPIEDLKIQKITIKWKEYKIVWNDENKDLSFDLEKDGFDYILNYDNAFPDLKVKVSAIPKLINDNNKTNNWYKLFNWVLDKDLSTNLNKTVDSYIKKWQKALKDNKDIKNFIEPDIYLKEIK